MLTKYYQQNLVALPYRCDSLSLKVWDIMILTGNFKFAKY